MTIVGIGRTSNRHFISFEDFMRCSKPGEFTELVVYDGTGDSPFYTDLHRLGYRLMPLNRQTYGDARFCNLDVEEHLPI